MLRFISSATSFSTKHSSLKSHEKKDNPIKDLRDDQRLDKNSFPNESTTRTKKGLVSCEFICSVDFIDYISVMLLIILFNFKYSSL